MDRDDRCPGAEIGISDQCIELAPGLNKPRMDLLKPLTLGGCER